MTKDKNKIKYFAYVRKSTEGEERQALSIPAQKDKLKEIFGDIEVEFIEDKASAFKPFNRPNFASMLERIRKVKKRIDCVHPDRLSRNEKDAGESLICSELELLKTSSSPLTTLRTLQKVSGCFKWLFLNLNTKVRRKDEM
jgi:DNA invertase Pin-like site-specific DNA recombinase